MGYIDYLISPHPVKSSKCNNYTYLSLSMCVHFCHWSAARQHWNKLLGWKKITSQGKDTHSLTWKANDFSKRRLWILNISQNRTLHNTVLSNTNMTAHHLFSMNLIRSFRHTAHFSCSLLFPHHLLPMLCRIHQLYIRCLQVQEQLNVAWNLLDN